MYIERTCLIHMRKLAFSQRMKTYLIPYSFKTHTVRKAPQAYTSLSPSAISLFPHFIHPPEQAAPHSGAGEQTAPLCVSTLEFTTTGSLLKRSTFTMRRRLESALHPIRSLLPCSRRGAPLLSLELSQLTGISTQQRVEQ